MDYRKFSSQEEYPPRRTEMRDIFTRLNSITLEPNSSGTYKSDVFTSYNPKAKNRSKSLLALLALAGGGYLGGKYLYNKYKKYKTNKLNDKTKNTKNNKSINTKGR